MRIPFSHNLTSIFFFTFWKYTSFENIPHVCSLHMTGASSAINQINIVDLLNVLRRLIFLHSPCYFRSVNMYIVLFKCKMTAKVLGKAHFSCISQFLVHFNGSQRKSLFIKPYTLGISLTFERIPSRIWNKYNSIPTSDLRLNTYKCWLWWVKFYLLILSLQHHH